MRTLAQDAVRLRPALNRVPRVTAMFWVVKVLTTGMGETTSDFFVKQSYAPEIAVAVAFVALVVMLVLQFRLKRYVAGVYWTTALAVSVFGTMAADVLHVGLGVPYIASTIGFAVVLAAIFVLWYRTEHTLSVHAITTTRRECFYWATVLTTFALGTAAGDWTATTLGLGYLASGVLFAAIIALPALAHRYLGLNAVLAFWFAYIVTRPLGASFADWLAVTPARGGLDLGPGLVSLVAFGIFVVLVGVLSVRHRDVEVAPAV
ncbi:MAG: COG4705 family protein [Amnibacterium sp.]